MRKIKRNAIRCKHCGDIIESTHVHDYKRCSCGCVSVDGGLEYLRRGAKNSMDDFEELSEYEEETRSCIDCANGLCRGAREGNYPEFCLTKNMDADFRQEAVDAYTGENFDIMQAAAAVEDEFYGRMTRVEETIEFAKKMGYKKIGIATCLGLLSESNTFAKILRAKGFEVFGICCKAGAVPKVEVGIDYQCKSLGPNMCNPILQAMTLNEEKTDLNVVIGLCVGHDTLFYKHSEAPVTTLVVKDRVLAHNPVGALYTAKGYYSKLMKENK